MAPIAGYKADVYLAAQTSLAFTDEATTNAGDNQTYTITNAAKRFWDAGTAVTVKKNGGSITTGFTIQYCGGKIVFAVANDPGDVIIVTGKYLPVAKVAEGRKWSLDVGRNLVETATFGDEWEESTPVRGKASASIERHWVDEFFLTHLGELVALVLYADYASAVRWECFAYCEPSANVPVDGVMGENLKFTVSGEVYYYGS